MPTAKTIMTKDLVTLSPDTLVSAAIERLEEHGISGAPVVGADGDLLGVVSVKDLLRAIGSPARGAHLDFYGRGKAAAAALQSVEGGVDLEVSVVMAPMPITVDEDAPLAVVADTMLEHGIHRVLVTDASKLVGIISALDFVRLQASDPTVW